MAVVYQLLHTDYDGAQQLVTIEWSSCQVITKSEFKHSVRWLVSVYINSQLIDILSQKFDFQSQSIRLLDIGWTYVLDTKHGLYVDDEYMLAAQLVKNPYVARAVSVDLRCPTLKRHQDLTVLGNVLDDHTQHQILNVLQNRPNIIIASQVLVNDLEEYMEYEYIKVPTQWVCLEEAIAKVARNLLDTGGLLLVNNVNPLKCSDAGIPQFLRDRSDHLRFLVEDGLTRVYQK